MRRFYIVLSEEERTALQTMAELARRDPRMQAALLVRQGLEQAGLVQALSLAATQTIDSEGVNPLGDAKVQP